MNHSVTQPPCARWTNENDVPSLELSGDWLLDGPQPEIDIPDSPEPPRRFSTGNLGRYDSTLPAFLLTLFRQQRNPEESPPAKPDFNGLPPDLTGLMDLALAVPEEIGTGTQHSKISEIKKLGTLSIRAAQSMTTLANFTGQTILSLGRLFTGHAKLRPGDFWTIVQQCGAQALPIVTLISFLTGMILAFVGNVQLANFGASLYVADLVAIAMLREMGVMMTAIIVSGRTGAAFAAHLGSMKANEEIDALKTFGFNPFDFLVLPRVIALVLMMPILTIYSNVIGILGGMLVGAAVDIPPILYWNETLASVNLTTASLGVFKSIFFGATIAISGCQQGMKAANSSAGVGTATTRAVVAAITTIIILDSAFAAIFTILDI